MISENIILLAEIWQHFKHDLTEETKSFKDFCTVVTDFTQEDLRSKRKLSKVILDIDTYLIYFLITESWIISFLNKHRTKYKCLWGFAGHLLESRIPQDMIPEVYLKYHL